MPVYAPLLGAGAVWLERAAAKGRRWLVHGFVAALVAFGLLAAPLCMPLVPHRMVRGYGQAVARGPLFPLVLLSWIQQSKGYWRELAHTIGTKCGQLTGEQRGRCMILASNTNTAGTLQLFSGEYGLPPVYSPHLFHYGLGPPPASRDVVIAYGFTPQTLSAYFGRVQSLGTVDYPECDMNLFEIPHELFLCEQPRQSPEELWKRFRPLAFASF